MHGCHSPITANAKLAASDLWNEPIRPETLKHRRFIWATQFGCGSSGSATYSRPAKARHRSLAERTGVAELVRERQARRVAEKAEPPKVIYGR